jgi:hypothetical protein
MNIWGLLNIRVFNVAEVCEVSQALICHQLQKNRKGHWLASEKKLDHCLLLVRLCLRELYCQQLLSDQHLT